MSHTKTIDEASLKLLRQVDAGIIIFEPFRRRSPELLEFQLMVKRLLNLEKQGLVGRCITQEQEIAGQTYYDLCMVYTGITNEGRKFLAEQQGMS